MKRIVFIAFLVFAAATPAFAQGRMKVVKISGVRAIARDALGRPIENVRSGPMIWNNMAVTGGWWSGPSTDYLNLDWGILQDQGNDLPDEVIDGFTFFYGTNNRDPAGEDISVYFFDSCTGWGNRGVQEAGFLFTGLPNALSFGTMPP